MGLGIWLAFAICTASWIQFMRLTSIGPAPQSVGDEIARLRAQTDARIRAAQQQQRDGPSDDR